MKYIRTKDGIWLNGGKFGYPRERIVGKKHEYDFGFCFDKKDILKQADTIEELCDGLVIVPKNKKLFPFSRRLDDYDFIPLQQEFVEAVYGAIYIEDKGIIFVAKMNDKGELELLKEVLL